jgi:Protein of unknown function (DUF3572)
MARVNRITREAAEALGIQALAWLAGDPERLGRFLALSGLGPDTIRTAAHDPRFLAGVLEYIAGDEALLVACAEHVQAAPEHVAQAQAVLAGPAWERDTA